MWVTTGKRCGNQHDIMQDDETGEMYDPCDDDGDCDNIGRW